MNSTVITKVIEKMETLPEKLQLQTLAFDEALQPLATRGVPGKQLLEFAGSIPIYDLKLMQQAIENSCEQVDPDEW